MQYALALALLFVGVGSMSVQAEIEMDGPSGWSAPHAPAAVNHDNLRWFKLHGKELKPAGQCSLLLREAQNRLGRQLTQEEIERNLPAILTATGESLVEPPQSTGGCSCFTGEMTIATPQGRRLMRDLKAGDEVISIDLQERVPVINRIHAIYPSYRRKFGILADLKYPIEVTAEHRFLSQGPGLPLDYRKVGTLKDTTQLIRIIKGSYILEPRGRYLENVDVGTVYDISLEGEPRNFIVEGILVHNIKF